MATETRHQSNRDAIWSGPLELLDVSLDSPAKNLALDDLLLLEVDAGLRKPVLRLWESSQPVVVLGRSSKCAIDVDMDACRAESVPILRRSSGGGTVVLGPGCLMFSVVLKANRIHTSIQAGIEFVLKRMSSAIKRAGCDVAHAGTSDLIHQTRKFSGNSQRWKRGAFLHHGTLLYDANLEQISRLLRSPERQPDYRRDRSHADFVRNLNVDANRLRQAIIDEWQATTPAAMPDREKVDLNVTRLPNVSNRQPRGESTT